MSELIEIKKDSLTTNSYEIVIDRLNDTVDMVNEGHINPLRAYVAFKNIEKALSTVLDKIKDQAISEAEKHGKNCTILGAEVSVKNAAGRWSYKHIQRWNELNEEIKALQEAAQQAYHAQSKGAAIVNEATGEIVPPAEYTNGQTTISVKI